MRLSFGPLPPGTPRPARVHRPQTTVTRQARGTNAHTDLPETMAARSTNGEWRYEASDEDHTWDIHHLPTGLADYGYSSLTAAREATANPSTLDRLTAQCEADAANETWPDGMRAAARTTLQRVAAWRALNEKTGDR